MQTQGVLRAEAAGSDHILVHGAHLDPQLHSSGESHLRTDPEPRAGLSGSSDGRRAV